jgi:hypothetical protein
MSRLDICARSEDAASISRQRQNNLRTRTTAVEDGTEVVRCLWADFVRRNGGSKFPSVCEKGERCCLVNERYWDDPANELPTERLFS